MKKNLQSGFSLIELLVSMLIAGIVFAGVVNVVLNSRVAFVNEQEASYIQENARYAVELLTRDIRIAGSMECASIETAAVANTVDGDLGGLFSGDAINGYEGSSGVGVNGTWPTAYSDDASNGSDSVILRYADPDSAVSIDDHTNYKSAVLKLHEDHDFEEGQMLMIVDPQCRSVGIFQVTPSNNNSQISHNSGNAVSPGNCTKVLYAMTSFTCSDSPCNPVNCAGNPAQSYSSGATVLSFVANAYYIGESSVLPGVPALKRQVLTNGSSRSEELAQGVEDMELQFGVNSDIGSNDNTGDVDYFVDAHEVTDWSNVVAVRYSLVLRSQSEVFDDNQRVSLLGVDYEDRYLRQLVSSTVRIRNRG